MTTAFQSDAFQNDAFQIDGSACTPAPIGSSWASGSWSDTAWCEGTWFGTTTPTQQGGGVVRMSPRIKPPVLFDDEDALILMLMEILANE
jgi:hypothetical protein